MNGVRKPEIHRARRCPDGAGQPARGRRQDLVKRGKYVRRIDTALTQERIQELGPEKKRDDWCPPNFPIGDQVGVPKTVARVCPLDRGHRPLSPEWDHYKLAIALIEDALSVLVLLKRGKGLQRGHCFLPNEDPRMLFRETVYWFFYERDPDCERVCSLDWCCEAINAATGTEMNSDMIRDQAARLGLMPRSYR